MRWKWIRRSTERRGGIRRMLFLPLGCNHSGCERGGFFALNRLGRELRDEKAPGPRSLEKVTGEREAT